MSTNSNKRNQIKTTQSHVVWSLPDFSDTDGTIKVQKNQATI